MRFALALALAFAAVVCLPLTSLAAQDAEPIGPGTRIRVVSVAEGTSRRVVGTVMRVDSAGVAIARGGGREGGQDERDGGQAGEQALHCGALGRVGRERPRRINGRR